MSSPSPEIAVPSAVYGIQEWPSRNVAITLHAIRHLGLIGAVFFVPLNLSVWLLFGVGFLVRMWAVETINHRYFAHRAFATSRLFQFFLALVAAQAACRGPLWWAYIHRRHHSRPDTPEDPHSPVTHPFFEAYFLWLTRPENRRTDLSCVRDFACYPELRWVNKHSDDLVFGAGACLMALGGHFGVFGPDVNAVSAVLWGVCAPAVIVLHCTGLLSTLCHLRKMPGGYRRFQTRDESINRPIVALITLGAGFHNNHHRLPSHARSGLAWYEIDVSYYTVKALEALGLVWDVRDSIPQKIKEEGRLTSPTFDSYANHGSK